MSSSTRVTGAIEDRDLDVASRAGRIDSLATYAASPTAPPLATLTAATTNLAPAPVDTSKIEAWDPNKTYWGEWEDDDHQVPHPGGADEVEWQGAYWIAGWNNVDFNPMIAYASADYKGMWTLDTRIANNHPIYDQVAPEAPKDLDAGYTSDTAVALFWDKARVLGVGEVSSYDVLDNGVKIGSTSAETFTVTGLTAGSQHNFSVVAWDAAGKSGASDVLNLTTHTAEAATGKVFSPYVDMTLPSTDLVSMSQGSGLRDFTLAFQQSVGLDNATGQLHVGDIPELGWGGILNTTISTGGIIDGVHAVEAQGGTVTVAFGGYTGIEAAYVAREYAQNLHTAEGGGYSAGQAKAIAQSALQAEYQSVISTYGVTHLDFDIEDEYWAVKNPDGSFVYDEDGNQVMLQYLNGKLNAVQDTVANQMRDVAIKGLQDANPDLHISFTLATDPTGLSKDSMKIVTDALAAGVKIDTINLMVMDYGNPKGKAVDMLANAKSAALALEAWLTSDALAGTGAASIKVGLTPMIGHNDVAGETFSLHDAMDLRAWAASKPWIASMGEWSLSRDHPVPDGANPNDVDGDYSGVDQTDYQFSQILHEIGHVVQPGADADIVYAVDAGATLSGLGGNDSLYGGLSADSLNGGNGVDILTGGSGADTLVGGGGSDRFVFLKASDSTVTSSDRIIDLSNKDTINLKAIDANSATAADDAFHLAGDHFTHQAGELIVTYDSGSNTTLIQGDTNGDGAADFSLSVRGDHHTFTHFVL